MKSLSLIGHKFFAKVAVLQLDVRFVDNRLTQILTEVFFLVFISILENMMKL